MPAMIFSALCLTGLSPGSRCADPSGKPGIPACGVVQPLTGMGCQVISRRENLENFLVNDCLPTKTGSLLLSTNSRKECQECRRGCHRPGGTFPFGSGLPLGLLSPPGGKAALEGRWSCGNPPGRLRDPVEQRQEARTTFRTRGPRGR